MASSAASLSGWKEFKRIGLAPPKSIIAATEKFMDEQGGLLEWMSERCDTTEADAETPTDDLYESFRSWFEETFHRKPPVKLTKQAFGMRLGKKYPSGQRDNVKVRRGIKLRKTHVPEYDLDDPCIVAPGMCAMDYFYELEIENLIAEAFREAA